MAQRPKCMRGSEVLAQLDAVESDETESDDTSNSVSEDEEATSSEDEGEGSSDVDDDASDSDQSVVDTDNWHKLNTSTNAFVRLPFTVSSPGIQIGLRGANVPKTELEFFQPFFYKGTCEGNNRPHKRICTFKDS